MRKVQVLVEVEVQNDHPLTEQELVHIVKRKLTAFKETGEPLVRRMFLDRYGSMDQRFAFRPVDVKEFRRVKEYLPGGVRDKHA